MLENFSKICGENSIFIKNLTRITGTLHGDRYTYFIISRSIKTYKRQPQQNKFIIIYYFKATCFDSLQSSSGPLKNRPKTI